MRGHACPRSSHWVGKMLEEVGETGKGQRSSCGGSPFPGTWTLNITSLTPMALSTCSGQALDSQAPCALPPLLDVVQV